MKVYLDNCCYNRPFDDQSQMKISLETQAKLYVQDQIKKGNYDLVWSYVLDYETSKNPFSDRKAAIMPWRDIATDNIKENEKILAFAEKLSEKNIKTYDALHIACAVNAGCSFFLTTDKKLLNTPIPEIRIVSPVQFIQEQEERDDSTEK